MSISIPVKEPPNTSGLKLHSINRNENGDYYIIFLVPDVTRGIRGKTKGKADELLIVGVPKARIDGFLRAHYLGESKREEVEK